MEETQTAATSFCKSLLTRIKQRRVFLQKGTKSFTGVATWGTLEAKLSLHATTSPFDRLMRVNGTHAQSCMAISTTELGPSTYSHHRSTPAMHARDMRFEESEETTLARWESAY